MYVYASFSTSHYVVIKNISIAFHLLLFVHYFNQPIFDVLIL
jgi:hypothetical protein